MHPLIKPSYLKLEADFTELAENSFMRQIHDKDFNKALYEKYQEDFKRIIVDEDGNYLYTKPISKENAKEHTKEHIKENPTKNALGMVEYASFIDRKLKDLDVEKSKITAENVSFLTEKSQGFFLRKTLIKDQEKKRKKTDMIEDLKARSYQKISEFLSLKNKQELVMASKREIDILARENGLIVEKLTKEKYFY